jgi:G:T-mismatch repair DNA endonuclease (very short patch repair protein)
MIWTKEELDFIENEYKKGLTKKEVYNSFVEFFGNTRTEYSISLKLKRLKISIDEDLIKKKRSNASSGSNNGMFGKEGPNKGLTKENSERIKNSGIKISETRKKMFASGELDLSGTNNGMYGKSAWNSGLTKLTDERVYNYSKNMSDSAKLRWDNYTQEEKNEIIGRLTLGCNKAKKDTSIELKIENLLNELGIKYEKQHRLSKWVFDFYLPEFNTIIECQGDYWHANPLLFENKKLNNIQLKNIDRDKRKKLFIGENQINSIFLWECEIHSNIEEIKNMLITLFINE